MFSVREMYTTNELEVLKAAQSSAIMTPDNLLIGDSEGLYMLDMTEEELYKFGDKDIRKVSQISMIQEEGLVVLLAGKLAQRVVCVCVCVLLAGELAQWVVCMFIYIGIHLHVLCT